MIINTIIIIVVIKLRLNMCKTKIIIFINKIIYNKILTSLNETVIHTL